ncbi:hypothetical protein [Fervidibacillus halotolerans]|uniref:Type IV pilus assembly protein PilO n=1 Tax=Fervidibacillus halotolerans TaxID=2980027 RepID=A0A9E8LZS5_9BACI|nr:hypothetical protein [Fervidibacillus halotolerans]WAA12838.1 hypothetical protein OE105_01450 [Fervidibacillus halotolerans]
MNELLHEKKKLALLLIIILFLLFGLLYVYMLLPVKKEVEQKEITVQQLKDEITILQSQFNQREEAELENTFFLEKKLPRSRKIDDLVLDLQRIEYVSNSRIEAIDFTNYDGSFSDLDLPKASEENKQQEEAENNNGMDETANTTDEYTNRLPENVKYITLQLSVTSPDFEHFFTFLEEVEKLERVVNVDRLSFSKPGEEELLSDEPDDEFIRTDIELTTFYYDS